MSAQHTPGPWEAQKWHCHAATSVRAGSVTIAECSGLGRLSKDCEADACLIAAAPDLLEALKAVLKDEKWHAAMADEVTDGARDNIKMAEAAIAKATGIAS